MKKKNTKEYPETDYTIDNSDLSKYPSELEIESEGIKLEKGDIIRLIDKSLGIEALYKITNFDKKGNTILKFIKKIEENKMNKLENEIYRYLSENITRNTVKWTHDLAKIAENENKEYIWENNNSISGLIKENIELKKTIEGFRKSYAELNDYSDGIKIKLADAKETIKRFVEEDQKQCNYIANQKFLNRSEVEKKFDEYTTYDSKEIEDGDDISWRELVIYNNDNIDEFITAICDLAYDRNKIIAILVGKILESDKDAIKIADEIIKAMGEK